MAPEDDAPTAVEDRPEETPAVAADRLVDTELIQNRLREKEQLVAALTERLEQAAEQLDRLRRTGVDKGRRPLGGGFPAEVVEEHKTTLEDLKRVISRWEDMQAEVTLGRIETQIAELRDLMVGSGQAGTYAAPRSTAPPPANAPAPQAPPRERPADAQVPRPAGKGGSNAWWEAQKAALMGEPLSEEAQAALEGSPTESSAETLDDVASPLAASGDLAELKIPDLPAPVDFENITLEEARAAIRERDAVIGQLREPLMVLQVTGQLPADLPTLEHLPAPLRDRIAELEVQWQSKFRQAELEVSLERARLAREQAAVRQQQDALQKQFRKEGLPGKATGAADGKEGEENSSSKRRWFRFMGKAGDENGESDTSDTGK
jgi:hypothetical protein